MQNIRTQGQGHFKHLGHNLNQLGRGPLGEATYQIFRLYVLRFRQDVFFSCFLCISPCYTCDPRAYLNKHGTGQLDKSDATHQISMP